MTKEIFKSSNRTLTKKDRGVFGFLNGILELAQEIVRKDGSTPLIWILVLLVVIPVAWSLPLWLLRT